MQIILRECNGARRISNVNNKINKVKALKLTKTSKEVYKKRKSNQNVWIKNGTHIHTFSTNSLS